MLKTLHGYLTRDLVRVMLLALVALTLLLTVLTIIQPLLRFGLAGEAGRQVVWLFLYTLPMVLSFTLPVATLFAATLVYGRFSQDNELLACRASGVSMLALLRPALGIGTVVTVASLVLSNVVAPSLTTMAGLIKANVRGVVYHRLRTAGYLDIGKIGQKHVIHADGVDADRDMLHGVIYTYVRKPRAAGPGQKPRPGGAVLATASSARLTFLRDPNGNYQVVIQPTHPSIIRTGEDVGTSFVPDAGSIEFIMPLDNPVEEKASWYNWQELLGALENPAGRGQIKGELERLKKLLCGDMLASEVAEAAAAGRSYAKLAQGNETYEIQAPAVEVDEDGSAVLKARMGGGGERRVEMILRRSGQVREIVSSRSGRVTVAWSPVTRQPQVTLRFRDDVRVTFLGPEGRRESRAAEWVRGEVPVPPQVRQRADAITLADLRTDPDRLTRNPRLRKAIALLMDSAIPRMRSALIAELHARVAYGLSCFLMVAMGAALGLIFRGGQFISAFAISAVPGFAVIALLLMGKEMARNPSVGGVAGLACIWGGIALMLAANVVIYGHLARK